MNNFIRCNFISEKKPNKDNFDEITGIIKILEMFNF